LIFAVETEEQTLRVFRDEAHAVSHCEGLDVEAAIWLFWDNDGRPLEAEFTEPNRRGLLFVRNGRYRLVKARPDHHADLLEALERIKTVEGPPPLDSIAGVRDHLRR
jgi:hypothetical protein